MLDAYILKELKSELNMTEGNDIDRFVSVCYSNKVFNMYNIVKCTELTVNSNVIQIESGYLDANLNIDESFNIYKLENEVEKEYILTNGVTQLCISVI